MAYRWSLLKKCDSMDFLNTFCCHPPTPAPPADILFHVLWPLCPAAPFLTWDICNSLLFRITEIAVYFHSVSAWTCHQEGIGLPKKSEPISRRLGTLQTFLRRQDMLMPLPSLQTSMGMIVSFRFRVLMSHSILLYGNLAVCEWWYDNYKWCMHLSVAEGLDFAKFQAIKIFLSYY